MKIKALTITRFSAKLSLDSSICSRKVGRMKLDKTQHLSNKEKRMGLMIWFRLAKVYHQINRINNQHLKAYGLSSAQFDALVQIGSHQPITQNELAERLFVTKGNITQLLSKMEKANWIMREREWKTKTIYLTDEGTALFHTVVLKQEDFQASQFMSLETEEQKQLLELLKKVQKQLDSQG